MPLVSDMNLLLGVGLGVVLLVSYVGLGVILLLGLGVVLLVRLGVVLLVGLGASCCWCHTLV